jgi:hypothetical protein
MELIRSRTSSSFPAAINSRVDTRSPAIVTAAASPHHHRSPTPDGGCRRASLLSAGAAEPHFQVHERRVARFEVAERIGGGGDLVGLRSKPPFIGGTSEGKRSVHFLLSTQKRGAARAAPKLEAARGLGAWVERLTASG